MHTRTRTALKEAVLDTSLATVMNVPLNFILAWYAVEAEWNAIQMTIYFTACFFFIAVARKTYLRLYFDKRARELKFNI